MTSRAVDPASSRRGEGHGRLLLALREETRIVHRRLERALPLTDPSLTIGAYRLIIEAFYGYYSPLEARLAQIDGSLTEGRAKLWRLRDDLEALGSSESQMGALPLCTRLPPVDSRRQALGCLYVVEGATLGGRIIASALGDHLGIGPETGASFFAGYGVGTGAMWRSLLAQLDASSTPPSETIGAAVDTFATFEAWLAAQGVLR